VTAGTGARAHMGTGVAFLSRAAGPLCLCALVLSCTDPRPRIAPPTVQVIVPSNLRVRSPGTIPVSIYTYDAQGLDQLLVSVRSGHPTLDGDSTIVLTNPNEETVDVVWQVPADIPLGTLITLSAKAKNTIGFVSADSVLLAVQP
jgi:hypothetical protein